MSLIVLGSAPRVAGRLRCQRLPRGSSTTKRPSSASTSTSSTTSTNSTAHSKTDASSSLNFSSMANATVAAKSASPASNTATAIPVPTTVATLPLWQRLGPLTRAFQAYGRSQRKRPYATQFVSSLVIYFLGDLSAQRIGGNEYDAKRTGRALLIGAGSAIPAYRWFMFLSSNFNYASPLLSLATKVVVNQLAFTPVFNSYFFGMQALLAGENLSEAWTRVRRTVPVSFINSCKLWPAVTAFSFSVVSPQYRSVFAGVIAIGWQTYLSFLNREAEDEERRARVALVAGGEGEALAAVAAAAQMTDAERVAGQEEEKLRL